MTNFQEKANFIWNLADLLRGSYKKNEYQKVILPFTVLKRFDSVLSYSKKDVLDTYAKYKDEIDDIDLILRKKAKDENGNSLNFYNYSEYTFETLLQDPEHIEENLILYIDCFSQNVQDIFENFHIKDEISKLSKANLLFLLIKKFSETNVDLSPSAISNHEMGTIFEELIRKFSETSNDEAGEHFTPRDVIQLMTELMFIDDDTLTKKNIIKKIYDPACGTGGMLTSCKNYILENNENIDIILYGQEINPEIYAICKADMLMKGEDSNKIKGPMSTLSYDQLSTEKFDYMISNPPYGRKWELDEDAVLEEKEKLGFDGRFGAGTPKKSDGQLLFIQHMLSKMKENEKSRIAIITNGSPLFTGDAGSGESNIRKWIIENDYLEALVALPDQLFFNTGIKTYIWILTNEKSAQRLGKIQLIDATEEYTNMRNLGDKRHTIPPESINKIKEDYKTFKETENVKIFDNEDFGYTKVVVERPLQRNYQVTEERLDNLYSIPAFKKLAESKNKNPEEKITEEKEGKQKQQEIIESLKKIGENKYTNYDDFEAKIKQALEKYEFKSGMIKNIILKLSEYDETAEIVTDKKGNPKADSELKDTEKIPLKKDIDEYFQEEVTPYYPKAWMDRKKDKIGYEINFTQYFYTYTPPRPLEEIEKDIEKITQEIRELIGE